ncbi:carboxymuconolactone decarboxylase family protein [Thiohalorhabdus sp. Cl-TMA]|uniref:Carboxymuconolactone decarboxylase family protein n=1 Tax=Thiohalorhabdus methylotrophus TaxID=3242694 RepID=A0ABV4TZH6_9GAMM
MSDYPVHTPESAPNEAGDFMRELEKGYGFIPNLAGVMATAPALVQGYFNLNQLFEKTSLSAPERQVVLLAASFTNTCDYCMSVHTALAEMAGVPEDCIAELRQGSPLPDQRLNALRRFTQAVVEDRGHMPESQLQAFYEAGFTPQNVLEVVLGVGMKTLSNYTNHIAETPLDKAFAGKEWNPPV